MSGWWVDKKGGHVVVIGPDGTEEAACGSFLDRLLLRGLSLHTVEAYAYDLVLMNRWLEASRLQLAEMNSGHLHEFLAWERGRDSSPKSINRRLHTLRLFFRHVSEHELPGAVIPRRGLRMSHRDRELGLQRIPGRDTRAVRVKEPRTIVEPLTVDQVNELLHSLRRYRDLGIAYLMLLRGLRSQEVLNLRVSDIDLEDRRLGVRGKGGKERAVPAPPLLLSVIEKYTRLERPALPTPQVFVILQGAKRGQPMTRAGLRKVFRTRRLRPALLNANPHRLRHTFGTDMVQAIWTLIPKAARDGWLSFLGTAAAILAAIGVHELLVLFGAGVIAVLATRRSARPRRRSSSPGGDRGLIVVRRSRPSRQPGPKSTQEKWAT